MFEYRATIDRVIDGDTVDAMIDLGCHVFVKERLRLFGINAPEMRGKSRDAGIAAKEHLSELLDNCGLLVVRTHKDKQGKYGRYLVELIGEDGSNLNKQMIQNGYAVEY